jgi:hypothetical protein
VRAERRFDQSFPRLRAPISPPPLRSPLTTSCPYAQPYSDARRQAEFRSQAGSASGLLDIRFFQECCNSQLIRVAFTLRRRCEDTRGQFHLRGRRSLDLRQDDYRLIQCGPHQLDFVQAEIAFLVPSNATAPAVTLRPQPLFKPLPERRSL